MDVNSWDALEVELMNGNTEFQDWLSKEQLSRCHPFFRVRHDYLIEKLNETGKRLSELLIEKDKVDVELELEDKILDAIGDIYTSINDEIFSRERKVSRELIYEKEKLYVIMEMLDKVEREATRSDDEPDFMKDDYLSGEDTEEV